VDTKRFTFSTSARTFRIAAELREAGADPVVIRELFTDSLDVMLYRAKLLQSTEMSMEGLRWQAVMNPMRERT